MRIPLNRTVHHLAFVPFFRGSGALRGAGSGATRAKSQPQSQPQSKEALYVKCRNAIFRKYGQPGVQYNHGPRYRVLPYTSVSQIDQCVANGGRAD